MGRADGQVRSGISIEGNDWYFSVGMRFIGFSLPAPGILVPGLATSGVDFGVDWSQPSLAADQMKFEGAAQQLSSDRGDAHDRDRSICPGRLRFML